MTSDKIYIYGCVLNALIVKGYNEEYLCQKALSITNEALDKLNPLKEKSLKPLKKKTGMKKRVVRRV